MEIFLLMGQSNMAGRGLIDEVEPIRDERILVLHQDQWITAEEPLHHDRPSAGIGLAMSFAQRLLEHDPDGELGLVPCAVGSTPIARWVPGADLYTATMRAAVSAQKSGSIRGILWHQGEHDSKTESDAQNYVRNFSTMIAAARRGLGDAALPVIVGGLGDFMTGRPEFPFFRAVHQALESLPSEIPGCRFVSSAGLTDKGDSLHFDARSQREFGRRYAKAYLEVVGER